MDLKELYTIIQCWDAASQEERSRVINQLRANRTSPFFEMLIIGLCQYIELSVFRLSSAESDLKFVVSCITCYVNAIRQDVERHAGFLSKLSKTLEEFRQENTAAAHEYDPVLVVLTELQSTFYSSCKVH